MDPAYKALRDKWYDLLALTGFDDIEDTNSPRQMLKCWDSLWFQSEYTPQEFLERQKHYQMSENFLLTYQFKSDFEREVWTLYANGLTGREIARTIEANKDRVNQTIRHLISR